MTIYDVRVDHPMADYETIIVVEADTEEQAREIATQAGYYVYEIIETCDE